MKIQSISDVITNSSTEVYLYADKKENVEILLDSIIKAINPDLEVDDVFKIESGVSVYHITPVNKGDKKAARASIIIESLLPNLFSYDAAYNG